MNVLLSNDDGITAKGLRALYKALKSRGHNVFVAAPMRQQSGVSHSITVFEPLRVQAVEEDGFSGTGVHGTPADCVKLGLAELAPWTPDLVMAGINLGKNVGPDVFYSGTIGAAAEGAYAGIPAMALSHADWQASDAELEAAANYAVTLAEKLDWREIGPGKVVSINFPAVPLEQCRGAKVCAQAPAVWLNGYGKRDDPRGWPYWWMEGELDMGAVPEGCDIDLLEKGYITVTPLKFEYTDAECLAKLDKALEQK